MISLTNPMFLSHASSPSSASLSSAGLGSAFAWLFAGELTVPIIFSKSWTISGASRSSFGTKRRATFMLVPKLMQM